VHSDLSDLFAHERPKKLPSFVPLATMPPLTDVDGIPLDATVGGALVRALAAKDLGTASVERARRGLDGSSVDRWLEALFEAWRTTGFNGRYGWVLEGMAQLGGDRCTLVIEIELTAWPEASESGRKRALVALEVLRRISTDTALLILLGVGQREVLPTLRLCADEQLRLAAKARKLTVGELGDHITPSCGLGPKGRRTFDFGPRHFETAFDAHFVPHVRDQAGVLWRSLPPISKGDDPTLARQAQDAWAVLSKQLQAVARVQASRLEEAMITQRRWKMSAWSRHLHNHPLMVHFTRRLIWGLFDAKDRLKLAFRTTEEGTCVDHDDADVTLPSRGRVGIVHTLDLDDAERAAWSEHLTDYEIVPPFEQLDRARAAPSEEEIDAKAMTRFASAVIDPKVAHDTFIDLGFTRDEHYVRKFFERRYESERLLVRVSLEPGMHAGASHEAPAQSIPKVVFRHGSAPLRLGKVPPVAFSEAVRAIHRVIRDVREEAPG